jgi:UDP-N-acetyl-D-glucosamine dehydrogenase
MLENLLKEKKAKICIAGLGYVGLPLAVEAAKSGFQVFGVDIQKKKADAVNAGKNYIADVADADLTEVVKAGRLKAFASFEIVAEADVVVICVPTPLNKYKEPDISYVRDTTLAIAEYIKKGTLVILESTTYPGTTEEIVQAEIEKKGWKAGTDFFVVFSPERVDPGNEKFKTHNIPKVVGGADKRSGELAALFYGSFVDKVHVVSSPRAAEMTKLLENIFRLTNISMINELALLCGRMDIDIWEVIRAASTKPYGFMPFYPGPGLGGHCIPIDPFYLSWKAKEYGFYTRFISLAGEINDMMPHYVVTKVQSALNSIRKSIRGSTVLVLGVAYKKDINDIRESPAVEIIRDLLHKGAAVSYNDDFIPEFDLDGRAFRSVKADASALGGADCVLVLTDHSYYNGEDVLAASRLLVDTRNLIKSRGSAKVFRL